MMRALNVRFAKALASALLLVLGFMAQGSWAQEIREFDKVWLKTGKTFVGVLQTPADAPVLKLKLKTGVIATFKKPEVDRVLPRQTAAEAYRKTSEGLDEKDAKGLSKLASWCLGQGMLDEALVEIKKSLKADASAADSYEIALQVMLEKLDKASPGAETEALHDQVLSTIESADRQKIWSLRIGWARARVLLEAELPFLAAKSYDKVLKALEEAGQDTKLKAYFKKTALLGFGQALLASGQTEPALAAFEKLLTIDSNSFQAYYQRGRVRMQQGQWVEAEQDLTRALQLEEAVAEAHLDRALALVQIGKLAQAVQDIDRALVLGIENKAAAHTQKALVYLRQGKLKSAGHALLEAQKSEAYAPAELTLALWHLRKGDSEAALASVKKAQSMETRDGFTEALLGRVYSQLGRFQEAEDAYARALRFGFEPRIAFRALAKNAQSQGQTQRCLQFLKYICNHESLKNADDFYRLGRAYLSAKRYDDARDAFAQALSQDASHVPSLLGIGFIEYQDGQYEKAAATFNKVKAMDANNAFALRGLKNIEESRTRKVWRDDFKREGPDIANRWKVDDRFGVGVTLKNNKVTFLGSQKTEDFGKTELTRTIDDGEFVRFEAVLNTKNAKDARVGIRLRARNMECIMFRSLDGKSIKAGFRKIKGTGKMQLIDLGPWPGDDKPHSFALEIEDDRKGLVSFHLDGERLGAEKNTSFKRLKPVDLVIYGQAAVTTRWQLELNSVRVFVRKPGTRRPTKKGNDF